MTPPPDADSTPTKQARLMHESLIKALFRVDRPGGFCVSGDAPMTMPGLEIAGLGLLRLPLGENQARELIALCRQAPYGKGTKTLVDTRVRQTWELDSSRFRCTNPRWKSVIESLLEQTREALGLQSHKLEAHPYKLLVYEKGGFFLPHRDGEKLDGMVATLTVVLPSIHEGGEMTVSHNGQRRPVSFDGAASGFELSFAAFYADCEHEVKPIESGIRLCLTYNVTLAQAGGGKSIGAPSYRTVVDALARTLDRWRNREPASKIAVLLEHRYTQNGLSMDSLKGTDRPRADVLFEAAAKADCVAHLALVTLWQFGTAEGGDDNYYHDWYDDDGSREGSTYEMGEIFEDNLSADHWSDRQGSRFRFGSIPLLESEIVTDASLEDGDPSEEEFEGYTGNAGMTLERWYHRAAVVIWPRDAHFPILCEAGTIAATAALIPMVEQLTENPNKAPATLAADCRRLAECIIKTWEVIDLEQAKYLTNDSEHNRFAAALCALDDPGLVRRFLSEVVAVDGSVKLDTALAAFCERHGWLNFEAAFLAVIEIPSAQILVRNAEWVDSLCRVRDRSAARRRICERLCAGLLSAITDFDGEPPNGYRNHRLRRAALLLPSVRAMLAIDATANLSTLVDHVLGQRNIYKLTGTQLKTLLALEPEIREMTAPNEPILRWLGDCRGELETLTADAPSKPTDLRRAHELPCNCEDCERLSSFLADPLQAEIRLPLRKDRRRHLHQIIDGNRCDVTHVTERSGSPYKLVCTKTDASYRLALRMHNRNSENLSRIVHLERLAAS